MCLSIREFGFVMFFDDVLELEVHYFEEVSRKELLVLNTFSFDSFIHLHVRILQQFFDSCLCSSQQ